MIIATFGDNDECFINTEALEDVPGYEETELVVVVQATGKREIARDFNAVWFLKNASPYMTAVGVHESIQERQRDYKLFLGVLRWHFKLGYQDPEKRIPGGLDRLRRDAAWEYADQCAARKTAEHDKARRRLYRAWDRELEKLKKETG